MNKSDKENKKSKNSLVSGKTTKENPYKEEYGYDFVPTLNEWTNIDEQRKMAKRLEDMTDNNK